MKSTHTRFLFGLSVAVAALSFSAASAKEFLPRVGIIAENHSNANRTDDPAKEISDTVMRPYFGFVFTENTSEMKAKADVLLMNESYSRNTFNSQFLPTIEATLDWTIQPNRLSWALEDYAYIQRIDVNVADVPDNQEVFNVLTTGPDFIFARGLYDGLAKLRVGDVYYSESDQDNQRLIATGILTRALNDYSEAGVDASLSSVLFEEDYLIDYDIMSLVGRYKREMPFGILELQGGVDFVDHENGASDSLPTVSFKISSNPEAFQAWKLTYSRRYTDPAMDAYDPFYTRLIEDSETRVIEPAKVVGVGAYETGRGEISYGYNGARFGLTTTVYAADNSYLLDAGEDSNEWGAGVGLSYLFSERISFWMDYFQSRTEYPNKNDGFAETAAPSIGMSYAITETLNLALGAYNIDNDSDIRDPTTNELTQKYKDNVVYLNVEYKGQSKRR